MKNYGDLGGCYPPRPTASTDNTLLDLHNSSEDTPTSSPGLFPQKMGFFEGNALGTRLKILSLIH